MRDLRYSVGTKMNNIKKLHFSSISVEWLSFSARLLGVLLELRVANPTHVLEPGDEAVLTPPRTKVLALTRLPSWFNGFISLHENPKVKPDAVQTCINTRDKNCEQDFSVCLNDLIEIVLKDGCVSFAEWKLLCFKKHAHGSPERAVFTKIMSHMRADFMIRNCEDYLRNHYMGLNFIDCCRYIRHRFDDRYYSVRYYTTFTFNSIKF